MEPLIHWLHDAPLWQAVFAIAWSSCLAHAYCPLAADAQLPQHEST